MDISDIRKRMRDNQFRNRNINYFRELNDKNSSELCRAQNLLNPLREYPQWQRVNQLQ